MSDPTPEDLYEALRKRLADYGQEPPAGLWAGIRQQLPPPVAVPRRRRWRASLALLSLLFVVAALATWQWQRAGRPAAQTTVAARRGPATEPALNGLHHQSDNSVATMPGGQTSSEVSSSNSAGSALGSLPNNSSAGEHGAAPATGPKPGEMASAASASAAPSGANPAARSIAPTTALALETSRHTSRRQRALAGAEVASTATAARPRLLSRSARAASLGHESATTEQPGGGAARGTVATARTSQPAAAGHPQTDFASVTSATLKPTETGRAASSVSGEGDARLASGAAGTVPAPGTSEAATAAAESHSNQTARWDWLNARLISLQLPAGAAPAAPMPTPVAVPALPPMVPTVVSRWAVQLVAGPGLTYRHLGTVAPSYTTNTATVATSVTSSPFTNANPGRNLTTTSTSAASLERPALGYGAQLSVRRTLTPHWTLSGGLGYAEYATQLAIRQVNAAQITRANYDFAFIDSLSRTSGTTIRQRDTYRFLTVPLRVGYAWTAGPRWQVGLLGGFDAAIYLGGTSTEGSPCACQPKTWSASGSPYRSLSLAANLGAEVRYRLAGPWQLLAQPTASYLLTPLAKPVSGYSIRHLFGATALLGVSYDLP
ncbi:outer membrane beta-barrel protein [Hymenobacter properus]|uniref:Outer membrane beta-barrel protein n=1 Tax=Hymenobacter properus TaxID=2791026 RepID=A0A931BL05_9BACT|nr:outer membrane beta-barrel protein [Hymenobacter properus]MBF9144242.1 outer membrane beta-barrel protein [Hymenobacter properus]MBR7723060.1 outer membrane beta-barrel protein [Microvirga sp. SRT04]